jgi:hypothetical protein
MSTPRLPVFNALSVTVDRWRVYYQRKKSAGLCVRNGCDKDALPDRTLCEKHGRWSREYAQKVKGDATRR